MITAYKPACKGRNSVTVWQLSGWRATGGIAIQWRSSVIKGNSVIFVTALNRSHYGQVDG